MSLCLDDFRFMASRLISERTPFSAGFKRCASNLTNSSIVYIISSSFDEANNGALIAFLKLFDRLQV